MAQTRGRVGAEEKAADSVAPHVQGRRVANATAFGFLQRAVGNRAVQRLATSNLPVQRYALKLAATASCDDVLNYIGAHSPYRPEAANTNVKFAWSGDPVISGEQGDYTATFPKAGVTVTKKVDMPQWTPTGPMAAPWNAAWATLRTHEGEHEALGDKWRDALETKLRELSISISASTIAAAKTEAKTTAEAAFNGWLPDHQAEQVALDPFDVIIDCPPTESE